MAVSIAVDEMIAEFERLTKRDSESNGLSTREIQEATGWSGVKTREFLRKAIDAGRVRLGKTPRRQIDGAMRMATVYVWVSPKKKPGRKKS